MWKQNYILVDEYFFFCCTWIVNSADIKHNGELDGLIVMPFRKGAEKGHSFAFLTDEVLPDAAQSLMNCVYVLIKKDS